VIPGFGRGLCGGRPGWVAARGLLLALGVCWWLLLSPVPARAFIYWTSGVNAMARANLDATGVVDPLFTGTAFDGFAGLAVGGGYIYWTATQAIGRATIDGCSANATFIPVTGPASTDPIDVAVDSGHVYWTNGGTAIGRANVDGTAVNEGFITGYQPVTVAVDANHVYWANNGGGGHSIGRANLDGTGATPNFISLSGAAGRLAVDAGHIYWVDDGAGGYSIGRANLNGTGTNEVFIPVTTSGSITGVAVDANYVYWSHDLDAIGRATIAGMGVTPDFITSNNGLGGVAVDALGPGPEFCAAPSAVSFAPQSVGTASSAQAVTITNNGAAPMHVSSVALAGADASQFLLGSDGCSGASVAAGGGTCAVAVAFDPASVGAHAAILHFTHDAANRPTDVTLTGTGTAATAQPTLTVTTSGVQPQPPPQNARLSAISGTPRAGQRLTCSTGAWSPSPASYSYQWNRDATPIADATSTTYMVRTGDEGLTLTCTVTASNAAGPGRPATSTGVAIPVPLVSHCPGATGQLRGETLGLAKLGMTRAKAHRQYAHSSNHGKQFEDFFCLTPIGVRVGYASPKLKKTLRPTARNHVADRVVWIDTANGFYALHGIRAGATVAAAGRVLTLGAPFHIGLNDWYFAPNGSSTALLKVRDGIVIEIGIADKQITQGHKAQLAFITSFT
jgi:hypothetical protein